MAVVPRLVAFAALTFGSLVVGCSAAPDDAPSSEEDVTASRGAAVTKCPGQSDFTHFACPASWAQAAKPQDCTCVSSRYDCMAPNPQASLDVDKNRARYLNGTTGTWPVTPGIGVYDGRHERIGTSTSQNVLVNYGQKKTMGGRTYVLARTVTLGANGSASGWLDAACVGWNGTTAPAAGCETAPPPDVKMPAVLARRPPVASQERVTAYRFVTSLPSWLQTLGPDAVKVVCATDDSHMSLGDYMPRARDGGRVVTTHLLFTLPGQQPALSGIAADTFVVAHQENGALVSNGVRFYRLKDVPAVMVDLYPESSADPIDGHPRTPFVYGYVKYQKGNGQWAKRFGWVAYLALEKA
jgi:hypothetical protein